MGHVALLFSYHADRIAKREASSQQFSLKVEAGTCAAICLFNIFHVVLSIATVFVLFFLSHFIAIYCTVSTNKVQGHWLGFCATSCFSCPPTPPLFPSFFSLSLSSLYHSSRSLSPPLSHSLPLTHTLSPSHTLSPPLSLPLSLRVDLLCLHSFQATKN